MRGLFTLLFIVFLNLVAYSQVIDLVFHEDFELPSLDDSVVSNSANTWGINTNLFTGPGSFRSDTCQVKTGTTVYLTTQCFSTVGYDDVLLDFSQICKINIQDKAQIEVSVDSGMTWIKLTGTQYLGTGLFAMNGNSFSCNSYGNVWKPGISTIIPDNTWWKSEQFDISDIANNKSIVMVRFCLLDVGLSGSGGCYGWVLDNIKVWGILDITGPIINLASNIPMGLAFVPGPYPVKAYIYDNSSIDSAYLVYSVDNGPFDSIEMVYCNIDTMIADLPAVQSGSSVCWYVSAFDGSLSHNYARNPVGSCISVNIQLFILPYSDNFDGSQSFLTPSFGGSNTLSAFQLGTPAYGLTTGAYSPPNAWDVNLNSAYASNGKCILGFPPISVNYIKKIQISFWINYNTELNKDGLQLQYLTSNSGWSVAGIINDPNGVNWYNSSLNSFSPYGWSGNSGGWVHCELRIDSLNNYSGLLWFRFVFVSDGGTNIDGVSIDDFSISAVSDNDISVIDIPYPNTLCKAGMEQVRALLKNEGLDTINSNCYMSYQVNNGITVTEALNFPILPDSTYLHSFATPVNMTVTNSDSTFNIKVWVSLNGDSINTNDTIYKTVISRFSPPDPVLSISNQQYGYPVTLSAVSAFQVLWYLSDTAQYPFASGLSVQASPVYYPTVFYAEAYSPNTCKSNRVSITVVPDTLPSVDLTLLGLISPQSNCMLTNGEPIIVNVFNPGTTSVSSFEISYSVNDSIVATDVVYSPLAPSGTMFYAFIQPADLHNIGSYIIKVWITCIGDTIPVNDTLVEVVTKSNCKYCDSYSLDGTVINIGNVTISNINNGNASPVLSNPSVVNTYTDFCDSVPKISLFMGESYPISIQPIFSTNAVNVSVKVFIDWNVNGIYEEAEETAFSAGPGTTSPFTGTIMVPNNAIEGFAGFRVVISTSDTQNIQACGSYQTGETEDYLAEIQNPYALDAEIKSLVSPNGIPMSQSLMPVTCIIRNFGSDTLSSIPVGYIIDNGTPVYETWIGNPIGFQDTASFTFLNNFPVPVNPFTLKVFTILPGDLNNINDTLIQLFQVTPYCQPIFAQLDIPNVIPAPDDSLFINVCRGSVVQFSAIGIYPLNNQVYHQSDSTSIFVWDFNDGTLGTGQIVNHTFNAGRIYNVRLKIIDIHNCQSSNEIIVKVKVSPDYIEAIKPALTTCVGTPYTITVGNSTSNTVHFNTISYFSSTQLLYDSATFIPDGGALGGLSLDLPITITDAPFGSLINSPFDILSVNINMEHSFVGDLEISLVCPNGSELVLKEYVNSGGAFLGIPLGGLNHSSYDCTQPSCILDPLQNPPGVGWDYSFSMINPVYNTMQSYANTGNATAPGGASNAQIDSSSYMPYEDFSNLIGCPINGTWMLKVTDFWAVDNGWVFWWRLNLDSTINTGNYEVGIDTVNFSGPDITSFGSNQITITPQNQGIYSYSVQIVDDFGCVYDTVVNVNVLPALLVDCGQDTGLPAPALINMNPIVINGLAPYQFLWNTGSTGSVLQVLPASTTTYYLTVTDAYGCTGFDSVTVNIGTVPISKPLLKDGFEWSVYKKTIIDYPLITTSHYIVMGDSLLNSAVYKKIMESAEESPANWNFSFLARDNGSGQVFAYFPGKSSEQMIFDFNLQVGDSAYISFVGLNYANWVHVLIKDTIYVASAYRERISIKPGSEPGTLPSDIWVSGLGSMIWGPMSLPEYIIGSQDTVICIRDNGNLIFQKPGFLSCHFDNVGITEIEPQSYVLYPNPVTNVSVFQTEGKENGKVILEIYDLLGRSCKHIDNQPLESVQIKHSEYRPGIYFYKLVINNNVFKGTFVVD